MADEGYPYPGISQITTADEWEAFFSAAQLDGVVSGLAPSLQSGARTVSMAAGSAYLRGYLKPVSTLTATAVPAAAGQDRVDRLVLRLDRSAATAAAYIVPAVLTGTAGTGTPPALTRGTTGVWDLPIGRWTSKSDGSLTGLVDERYGPAWFTSAARAAALVAASPARTAVEVDTGQIYRSDGSTWSSVFQDTGWINLTTNGPDGGAWTPNNICRVRRIGNVVRLRIAVKRYASSGLPVNDPGGSGVITLDQQFRPGEQEPGAGVRGGSPVHLRVDPDGVVRVYALTADIPANSTVFAGATYLVG